MKIATKNVYYMLSYAFRALNQKEYGKVETETFENIADLFAEILSIGINKQIKQGLIKDYIDMTETGSSPKGKINTTPSMLLIKQGQLNFTHDDFSTNNYLNRILKTTLNILFKQDITDDSRSKIRKLLSYFKTVNTLDVHKINWKIRYDRNNQNYRMLIGICYLTIKGLIQSEKEGKTKLMEFEDLQKEHKLYEKFLLNYFKKEHPNIKTHAPYVEWQLDSEEDYLLPSMLSDITLEYENRILIIDAKYYKDITQEYYGKPIAHSPNIYQIFTYVKNKEVELKDKDHVVSGMLLYAGTDEYIQTDVSYMMSGNKITIKTLDLNQDFNLIKEQLDGIVNEYLLG